MKNVRIKRNTWVIAGVCFFLSAILFLSKGQGFGSTTFLMVIACIASFINAYRAHKKMQG